MITLVLSPYTVGIFCAKMRNLALMLSRYRLSTALWSVFCRESEFVSSARDVRCFRGKEGEELKSTVDGELLSVDSIKSSNSSGKSMLSPKGEFRRGSFFTGV